MTKSFGQISLNVASAPLLPALESERSIDCSILLVVNMPKLIS
jgi:hypothetical protein